jgi:hypothetical protein
MNIETIDRNGMPDVVADIVSRVSSIENTTQPVSSDWFDLAPSEYNPTVAAGSLKVNYLSSDQRILRPGDKVRLKQTGDSNYRYFYVTESIPGAAYPLYAGDDYTLDTAKDVIELSYSRNQAPSGHPLIFSYSPDVRKGTDGSVITSWDLNVIEFYMIGNIVFMQSKFIHSAFPVGESQVFIEHNWINSVDGNAFTSGVTINQEENFYIDLGSVVITGYTGIASQTVRLGGNFASGDFWLVSQLYIRI